MGLFNRNKNETAAEETVSQDFEPAADTSEETPIYQQVTQPEPIPDPIPQPEPEPAPAPEPEPEPEPEPAPEPEKREGLFSRPVTEQDVAVAPGPESIEERERHSKRMQLLKTGDLVWSWILMKIPVIGWIVAIIWAAGLCRKRQRKYYARAFLVLSLIGLVVFFSAYGVYTLVFKYRFEDLPMVLTNIWTWWWNWVTSLFKK